VRPDRQGGVDAPGEAVSVIASGTAACQTIGIDGGLYSHTG
jgi:hypothetical protein